MNYSGIIRRVDELGRVVIPVEIRRVLNIKDGENLEFIINKDVIELRKKSCAEYNDSFFKFISDKLRELVEGDFIITDRKIVVGSSNTKIINLGIDNKLLDLLHTYDNTLLENEELNFENTNIKSSFYIYPYYVESDIAGYIIIYNINNIERYSKLIKFIISYIHDKLSL